MIGVLPIADRKSSTFRLTTRHERGASPGATGARAISRSANVRAAHATTVPGLQAIPPGPAPDLLLGHVEPAPTLRRVAARPVINWGQSSGGVPVTQPPTADEATSWTARWIAVEPPPAADPATAMLFGGGQAGFSRCLFRREFELDELPPSARARVSADSRYVLYVNGAEVGRGPARSQPSRQRYDSWDLTPYLHEGRNVVAALVTYYGKATSFWMPAPPGGIIGRDAVLIFEAALGPKRSSLTRFGAPPVRLRGRSPQPVLPLKVCRWKYSIPDSFLPVGTARISTTRAGPRHGSQCSPCRRPGTGPPTHLPVRSPAAPRHIGANGRARRARACHRCVQRRWRG